MDQPRGDGDGTERAPVPAERPERLIVPGRPAERVEADDSVDVRDLGSASRSCLVIIGILLALVLFACVAIVLRALIGG